MKLLLVLIPTQAVLTAAAVDGTDTGTGGLVQYGVLGVVSTASMSALWWMVRQSVARADRLETQLRDMEPRSRGDRLEAELRELNRYIQQEAVPNLGAAAEATKAVMRLLDRQGNR